MKKDISLKEVIETFFNSSGAVSVVSDIETGKNYRNRKIESYDSRTGDFTISGCKKVFNLNKQRSIILTIDSYSDVWCDFICKRYLNRSFRNTREHLEYLVNFKKIDVARFGGSWLKRTSDPKTFITYIDDIKINGVMTYGTATDFEIDGWRVGGRWSNTSSKHACAAGYSHLEYNFYPQEND